MLEREEEWHDAALQEAGPQVDQPKAVAGVVGARPVGWAAGVDARGVGCGAGGGVLSQRLARAGWSVVALDAGPFLDPDADWVSDEAGSHHLYWTEPRGHRRHPVPLGSNNSGRGVGGR